MVVDWDDDDAILEDFASLKSGDKSDYYIMDTDTTASDTLSWGPTTAEGACVKEGDPIGRVQIGGDWQQVDNSESKLYVGNGGKYQNAAVKWIGKF